MKKLFIFAISMILLISSAISVYAFTAVPEIPDEVPAEELPVEYDLSELHPEADKFWEDKIVNCSENEMIIIQRHLWQDGLAYTLRDKQYINEITALLAPLREHIIADMTLDEQAEASEKYWVCEGGAEKYQGRIAFGTDEIIFYGDMLILGSWTNDDFFYIFRLDTDVTDLINDVYDIANVVSGDYFL